jgi:hypothetical protein
MLILVILSTSFLLQTSQTSILFDSEIHDDGCHIEVIRSHLTSNIAAQFSDIQDEIDAAFAATPTKCNDKHHCHIFLERNSWPGSEWTTIIARQVVLSVVSIGSLLV